MKKLNILIFLALGVNANAAEITLPVNKTLAMEYLYRGADMGYHIESVNANFNGYVHPKIIPTHYTALTSVNIQSYRGSDTFLITQNTGSWLIHGDSGLSWDRPLVFINASTKKITLSGIDAEACQYLKIIGFGSDSAYGFEVVGDGVHTPVNFQAGEKGILIEGMHITHGGSGSLWVKEEGPHACDIQAYWATHGTAAEKAMYGDPHKYLAPYYQDSIFIRHNWIDSSGNDVYLGSTSGLEGRDALPCLGGTKPPTMQLHNIHFDSNYVNYLGRSVQISLATGGTNTQNDNIMTNLGYEWAETGGAQAQQQGGNRFGAGDVNLEVARNFVDYSNLYDYDLEEANINFHDNYGGHCNTVIYHGQPFSGGQALANVNVSASHTQVNPLIMTNNKMEFSSASGGINYALYGGGNFNKTNIICGNIGNLKILSLPLKVDSASCSGVDTACIPTLVHNYTHDTLETVIIPQRIDSTVITVFDTAGTEARWIKSKSYYITAHGHWKNVTRYDTIPADTITINCTQCAKHDTVLCIPQVPANYGLLDNNGVDNTIAKKIAKAQALGVQTIRYPYVRGNVYQVQTYKNSGLKVSLTFNWDPLAAVAAYPSDTAAVAHYLDSLFTIAVPDYLFVANEPANESYHTVSGAAYIKFLTACVRIAKKYGIPASIGGSTQDIIYPLNDYYIANGKTDSTAFLESVFGTLNPANSNYIAKSNFYSVVIPAVAAMGLFAWNGHWYEWATGDSTADANATATSKVFPVAADFIKKNTGLDWVCDEWATRNLSTILFNATATEIRNRCKQLMVYYLSDNSSLAKNNEAAFAAFVKANP